MENKIYIVKAFDPYDMDSFIIGYFLDKNEAEKTKKKYEYTNQTGYTKAKVITEDITNSFNDFEYDSSIVGYFAFIKDNNFTLLRDKEAYEKEDCTDISFILDELFDEYEDTSKVIEINNIAYTEVPYNNDDKVMEEEASYKINNFLKEEKENDS